MTDRVTMTGLNASLICDAMQRTQGKSLVRAQELLHLQAIGGRAVVGPAYTVRVSPIQTPTGEERAKWFSAIDDAPRDAVFVIQAAGDVGGAVFGEMVALRLAAIGVAGVVVDGPTRDLGPIKEIGIPFWTRNVTMRGMIPEDGFTEVGVPLAINQTLVQPGDLVAADPDGVIICPKDLCSEVLPVAKQFLESEETTQTKVRAGGRLFDVYPSKAKST